MRCESDREVVPGMQSLRFLGNLWYNKVGSNEEAILRPNMHKKLPFRTTISVALGVWLLVNWVAQTQVEAWQSADRLLTAQEQRPLQQSCQDGPDLVIQQIILDPTPPRSRCAVQRSRGDREQWDCRRHRGHLGISLCRPPSCG